MAANRYVFGPKDTDQLLPRLHCSGRRCRRLAPCGGRHGLVRAAGTEFVWQRSEEGWAEVIDKLAAMETGACHQYLDGPRDDVQIMASIGEYGDAWWQRYGS